jgi:zinc D-Ala-D-Ala dipeptidase
VIRPAAAAFALIFSAITGAAAADIPTGLVDVGVVVPSLALDLRYATPANATGKPLPGYVKARCWLTPPAAAAVAKVQLRLQPAGLGLLMHDCWRPQSAVTALADWVKDAGPAYGFFHPRTPRNALIRSGYIARHSRHTKGRAVDLTLVRLNLPLAGAWTGADCRASRPPAGSGWLDMGTAWDCFDTDSATAAPGLGQEARGNRAMLTKAMTAEGFRNYRREWWHFEFPE